MGTSKSHSSQRVLDRLVYRAQTLCLRQLWLARMAVSSTRISRRCFGGHGARAFRLTAAGIARSLSTASARRDVPGRSHALVLIRFLKGSARVASLTLRTAVDHRLVPAT